MWIDYLAWFILAASFIGMAVVVLRKLPHLRLLDTATLPEVQEAKVKQQIMIRRLERKAVAVSQRLGRLLRPMATHVAGGASQVYRKVLELEEELRNPPSTETLAIPVSIERSLEAAAALVAEERFGEAEEKYIGVIELDRLNLEAYRGLGALYLKRRDYRLAKESYAYVLKLLKSQKFASLNPGVNLDHLLACGYAELGGAVEVLEGPAAAASHYRKAVAIEPGNPRFLDLLLKVSILGRDKISAQWALEQLQAADPENAKLDALQAEVAAVADPAPPTAATGGKLPRRRPPSR